MAFLVNGVTREELLDLVEAVAWDTAAGEPAPDVAQAALAVAAAAGGLRGAATTTERFLLTQAQLHLAEAQTRYLVGPERERIAQQDRGAPGGGAEATSPAAATRADVTEGGAASAPEHGAGVGPVAEV